MNYGQVYYNDVANGVGCRTAFFVSGCTHHCKGCFQPATWDFQNGKPFTKEIEDEIISSMDSEYISGLTLLGGDPFEEENQDGLIGFMRRFKSQCPGKDVWAFTGYLIEDLLKGGRKHTEVTDELLSYVDILVDGPFVLEKKNIRLKFRGSENQRLIDMNAFRQTGQIVTIMGS